MGNVRLSAEIGGSHVPRFTTPKRQAISVRPQLLDGFIDADLQDLGINPRPAVGAVDESKTAECCSHRRRPLGSQPVDVLLTYGKPKPASFVVEDGAPPTALAVETTGIEAKVTSSVTGHATPVIADWNAYAFVAAERIFGEPLTEALRPASPAMVSSTVRVISSSTREASRMSTG